MERIESPQNRSVRRAVELGTPRGVEKHGAFLVEGPRFVSDILRLRGGLVMEVFLSETAEPPPAPGGSFNGRFLRLPEEIFRLVSDTAHSQGVVAVCRLPVHPGTLDTGREPASVLVLDGLADPGNAGTLLRCAAAFRFRAVLALEGTCNLFTTKVTRASAGTNAFVPIIPGLTASAASGMLVSAGYEAVAAETTGIPVYTAPIPARCALVLGSEAHGLSRDAKAICRRSISVPQSPEVESLNVATAGAVLMSWIGSFRRPPRT